MTDFIPPRNRDASPTIRGYVYQVDLTILRWLDLQPGQGLELECGEDIDLVSQSCIASNEVRERLLEQVKHRETSSLTLRTPEAIEALVNAFEHRAFHPTSTLIFRYTTNAPVGRERSSPMLQKRAGIHLWMQLSQGHMQALMQHEAIAGIRTLLLIVSKPRGIPKRTWTQFRSFLQASDDQQFLSFIQAFEWSTGNVDAYHIGADIQRRLMNERYARDSIQAQEQYQRLFLHVFRVLSQTGKKLLTMQDREYQLSLPLLSEQEQALLEVVNARLTEQVLRIDVLEQSHIEVKHDQLRLATQVQQVVSSQKKEKRVQLRSMLIDYDQYIQARLTSFVGRVLESEEIQRRIVKMQMTGGYVTITGQAGQGKSSIIAKLIHEYGMQNTVFHFIPLNPGPDHQVELLRNLIARLLLKHDLSDAYVVGEHRPILRSLLPKIFADIVAKHEREVIFIDGLDQLQEDDGVRDLSFLPNNPPPGIVFVLGTRPNDTLEPLKLLKPIDQYHLPDTSREDFDLILHHRQVFLEKGLTDRFYRSMQGNALFLDLVAKELREKAISPRDMIARIAHNPENIFSLSITRLKRQPLEWREVIRLLLGLLLTAREALFIGHIKHMLNIEHDRLIGGLTRLGGLLTEDERHRYSLFHFKLQEYLSPSGSQSLKESIFDTNDVTNWHTMLVQWCEREVLSLLWKDVKDFDEQERRHYARQHYLTHLYLAKRRERLFELLDEGSYGREKVYRGSGMPSYLVDLDLGRHAAVWHRWNMEEELECLPHLWRYTLLRCSLTSLADNYPDTAFRLLLLLKREVEALGLIELLTKPGRKVRMLLVVALHLLKQLDQRTEGMQILMQAYELVNSVEESSEKSEVLYQLGKVFIQVDLWERVNEVLASLTSNYKKSMLLSEVGRTLAQEQQQERAQKAWDEASDLIKNILDEDESVEALNELALSLAQAGQWERAKSVIENVSRVYGDSLVSEWGRLLVVQSGPWARTGEIEKEIEAIINAINTSDEERGRLNQQEEKLIQTKEWEKAKKQIVMTKSGMARIGALNELGRALAQAGQQKIAWELLEEIEKEARTTRSDRFIAEALSELGRTWAQIGQQEKAEAFWAEVKASIRVIKDDKTMAEALSELAGALARGQEWEEAEVVVQTIEDERTKIKALCSLGSVFLQRGQHERATVILKEAETRIRASTNRGSILWGLSVLGSALAQAHEWKLVKEIIREIDNRYWQSEVLKEYGRALTQTQRWELAKEAVQSMEDDWAKVEALNEFVMILLRMRQWDLIEKILLSTKNIYWRAKTLRDLGSTLAQANQRKRAVAVWEETERVIQAIDTTLMRTEKEERTDRRKADQSINNWSSVGQVLPTVVGRDAISWALKGFAGALAQEGEWQWAQDVIRRIKESRTKAEAFSEFGSILAQSGQLEQAGVAWREAEMTIQTIEQGDARMWVLRNAARTAIRAQQWKRAEEMARTLVDKHLRVTVLSELGGALMLAYQQERAEEVWQTVEEIIQSFGEAKTIFEAKREFIVILIQYKAWEKAEKVIGTIEESEKRREILYELAKALGDAHEYERLLHVVQQAWLRADTRTHALQMLPLVVELISQKPTLGSTFFRAFAWVNLFLKGQQEA